MGFRRVLFRALGRAYQADGGRAATARAVAAANQELHGARVRTKAARRQAKRREGEGTPLEDLRYGDAPAQPPPAWEHCAKSSTDEGDGERQRAQKDRRAGGRERGKED